MSNMPEHMVEDSTEPPWTWTIADPTPLGTLSMLPPEIRLQIWGFLLPNSRTPLCDSESCSPCQECGARSYQYHRTSHNRLAILRTSVRLREEVSAELYRRELCFCITPSDHSWSVKDLPGAALEDFNWAALDRFKIIKFEIRAPRKQDRIQLVEARDMTVDLVSILHEFLKRGKRLPKLKIVLKQTPDSTWINPESWNHSILPGKDLDVEYILGPFRVLRNIDVVAVKLPIRNTRRHGCSDEDVHLEEAVQQLESSMTLSDDFGTRESGTYLPKFEGDYDDTAILTDEDRKHHQLWCILSDLNELLWCKVDPSKPLWNQKLYFTE